MKSRLELERENAMLLKALQEITQMTANCKAGASMKKIAARAIAKTVQLPPQGMEGTAESFIGRSQDVTTLGEAHALQEQKTSEAHESSDAQSEGPTEDGSIKEGSH